MSGSGSLCGWADCIRPAAGPLWCEAHEAEEADAVMVDLIIRRAQQRLSWLMAKHPALDEGILAPVARAVAECEAVRGPEALRMLIERDQKLCVAIQRETIMALVGALRAAQQGVRSLSARAHLHRAIQSLHMALLAVDVDVEERE